VSRYLWRDRLSRKLKATIEFAGWELRVKHGDERVRRFRLLGGTVSIGRSTDCDVVLPSASVSRQHAKLEAHNSMFSITDLGSRNGVEVNGVRIEQQSPEAISPGDHILVADYVLMIMEADVNDEESTKGQGPTTGRRRELLRRAVEIDPAPQRGRPAPEGGSLRPAHDVADDIPRPSPAARKSLRPLNAQGPTDPRVKLPGHDGVQSMILLFLDIVDSTALTEQLGDEAFRQRSRKLDQHLRTLVVQCHGQPVEGKVLGDGILAIFMAAKHAIECALQCNSLATQVGLQLHLGLHAGDVIQDGGNVYGGAVNIAARVASASAPGEVLASETVRAISRTSTDVTFEDRGLHQLKGVGEAHRLFAVQERAMKPARTGRK